MKRQILDNTTGIEMFQQKLTLLEDHNQRNNVQITGISTRREDVNPITFLQEMLPKWILSLGNKAVEIERAHHIHSSHAKAMILQLLSHAVHNVMNGTREVMKNAPICRLQCSHTCQQQKAFAGVQNYLRRKRASHLLWLILPP